MLFKQPHKNSRSASYLISILLRNLQAALQFWSYIPYRLLHLKVCFAPEKQIHSFLKSAPYLLRLNSLFNINLVRASLALVSLHPSRNSYLGSSQCARPDISSLIRAVVLLDSASPQPEQPEPTTVPANSSRHAPPPSTLPHLGQCPSIDIFTIRSPRNRHSISQGHHISSGISKLRCNHSEHGPSCLL